MQKDLILCHYNGLHVEEIFKSLPKADKWARNAIILHNADIVAKDGNLDNEFWFLNEKIKSRCTIITMTADNGFIKDDPTILKRLGDYIETPKPTGNAKNRGIDEDFNKWDSSL